MINYFNYFTEVEEYFAQKRGKNLLVAPIDWCLIELWRDSGIPLHVALRGIERSFETAAKRQKRPPSTLFYCHPAVLEAFEEYQRAMVGAQKTDAGGDRGGDDLPEAAAVQALLEEIHASLAHRKGEVWERAAERIGALARDVKKGSRDYRELDRELSETGSFLAARLREELGTEEIKRLKSETRKELKIYKKRLSEEMYARIESTYLDRKTLALYDLPEFSFLGA